VEASIEVSPPESADESPADMAATPASPRRRFGARTAMGVGVGAAAAVVLVAVLWRPQSPPPASTPTQITAAPGPRVAATPPPSKSSVAHEPAELAGRIATRPAKDPNLELPAKTEATQPTRPARQEAQLRALENRVAEARRAAEAADAPKLAGSLWTKADATQRRAQDALKQEGGDLADRLFVDAQKAYQDAERAARTAAADARKRATEEAEQARAVAARAQQEETNQRVASAERARVAAVQRQQTEAEQARSQMLTARRAAEQAGADHHAAKLLESAQAKARDGQTALARSDYDAAGRSFREASSDYQNATQQAIRETELERRQLAILKSSAEQSKTKMTTRREDAVKAEAEKLAKPLFDAAQAKQAEADRLSAGQQFGGANQAYQDAAERYMEAGMQAQRAREARVEADKAKARMLAEKAQATQTAPEFTAALAEERQANSLYDRLAFKDASEKFRAAETLFTKAARVAPPPAPAPPERRRERAPSAPGTTF